MGNLIFILTTLALLAGFVALSGYEGRRGMRFFAPQRARLDKNVARIEFILAHVDFGAFLLDETRRFAARIGHDVAHVSLLLVRAAERLLTRAVRYLRTLHVADIAPRESARGYVKTLADFKGRLKATHPKIPDIH